MLLCCKLTCSLNDGLDAKDNIDMFLNLHNIKNIEMFIDSTKRKRCEDRKKVASQASNYLPPLMSTFFLWVFLWPHFLLTKCSLIDDLLLLNHVLCWIMGRHPLPHPLEFATSAIIIYFGPSSFLLASSIVLTFRSSLGSVSGLSKAIYSIILYLCLFYYCNLSSLILVSYYLKLSYCSLHSLYSKFVP